MKLILYVEVEQINVIDEKKKKKQIVENGSNEKGIVSISQTKLMADADSVLRLRSMQILLFLEIYAAAQQRSSPHYYYVKTKRRVQCRGKCEFSTISLATFLSNFPSSA